ncbi:hypothetical protein ACET3Z_008524 [Daucus carota]
METQIIATKLIKPAVPTPDHLRICKLTFLDQLAPMVHVPFMQFYKANHDENVQEKLLNSLSQTLIRFYPLAGRFIEDGWYIDCNDMGAEYIEAKINIELHEFLTLAPQNIHLLDHLLARNDLEAVSYLATTPILCLKVTTFRCGGIAICTHLSHKLVDGFTAAAFFREWSGTCKSNTIRQQVAFPPDYGLDKVFATRNIPDDINPKHDLSESPKQKVVTKIFVFGEQAISTLKSRLANGTDITRPTRVEAVTSTVLKAITAATDSRKDYLMFYCAINMRGRTSLMKRASEDNSLLCGNFCIPVPIKINRNDKNLEVQDVVTLMRTKIGEVAELCSRTLNPDDLYSKLALNLNEIIGSMGKENVDTVYFSSLCRFPFYEADFGWGKPEWVTTGGMTIELAFFMDPKSGGGIAATVCLEEEKMVRFECDPDILAFTS